MFKIGEVYRRRDLHTLYGGQQRAAVSTSCSQPFIFLFTSPRGADYGYKDGWQHDGVTFMYMGEGQRGDMTFTRGNLAIRDHITNGKAVHLFEKANMGHVRYVCELMYQNYVIRKATDGDKSIRDIIMFTLVLKI